MDTLEEFTQALATSLHATAPDCETIRLELPDETHGLLHTPRFWAEYQDGRPFEDIVHTLQRMSPLMTGTFTSNTTHPAITAQQLLPHLVTSQTIADFGSNIATPRVLSSTLAEILVVDYPDYVMWVTNDVLTMLHLTAEEAWALADPQRSTRSTPGDSLPTTLSLGGALWQGPGAADQAWDTVRSQPGSLFFAPAVEFAYAWPGGSLEPLATLVKLLPVFDRISAELPAAYHPLATNGWVVQPHQALLALPSFVQRLLETTAEKI